jgi:hypothetical protein
VQVPAWFGGVSAYGMGFTYIFSAGALFGHFATVSHLSELSMASAEMVGPPSEKSSHHYCSL